LGSSTDVFNLNRIDNQEWDSIIDSMEKKPFDVMEYIDKQIEKKDAKFNTEFDDDMLTEYETDF